MYNNVVTGVFDILIEDRIPSIRFNFRGVQNSTGNSTGGRKEIEDVKAVIDFLEREKNYLNILICGYSFGAAVGCSAVSHSEAVLGFIAISFPWDYMGKKFKNQSQTSKPKLFIQGDNDQIALFHKFKNHYGSYEHPKQYVIIEGADHFYWGYEKKVATHVLDFYNSIQKELKWGYINI